MPNQIPPDGSPPVWEQEAYSNVLEQAHRVSYQLQRRIQRLAHTYPDLRNRLPEMETAPELRGSRRVAVQQRLHLWVPGLFDVMLDTQTQDLSAGGLRLRSPFPLAPGTLLYIRPITATPDATWVPLEVRHCQSADDGWSIGCQFLNPDLNLDETSDSE